MTMPDHNFVADYTSKDQIENEEANIDCDGLDHAQVALEFLTNCELENNNASEAEVVRLDTMTMNSGTDTERESARL